MNSWHTNSSLDLFLDVRCNFPGVNVICLFGFDYFFKDRLVPYYLGVAAGPQYLEKAGAAFRDRSGVSFTLHAGYGIDLNRQMQLRIQTPFMLFAGTKIANSIGLEIQCIFFGPYRDVKVLDL